MPENMIQIADAESSTSESDSGSSSEGVSEEIILALTKPQQPHPILAPVSPILTAPIAASVPLTRQTNTFALTLFTLTLTTAGLLTSAACAYSNRPN